MKTLLCLFILLPLACFSQDFTKAFKAKPYQGGNLSKTELKDKMITNNFAKIWTSTDNALVYGFIGENYQRIRIKLIAVTKDLTHADEYLVQGKSMVKTNVCNFNGALKITNIRKYHITSTGVDDTYKNKGIVGQYSIFGTYSFQEDAKQTHSGVFKGIFQSDFYLTKDGRIHYDNIEIVSDGYSNNQFIGTWTSYNKQITKTCNWGDYRIPNCGDLDVGAGGFSPATKHLPYGWQILRNTFEGSKLAKKEENRVWWK